MAQWRVVLIMEYESSQKVDAEDSDEALSKAIKAAKEEAKTIRTMTILPSVKTYNYIAKVSE